MPRDNNYDSTAALISPFINGATGYISAITRLE